MLPLELHGRDRVLVVAPHPDDELISCGLLIQKALTHGADVRVVVATMGDAFGYAGPPVVRRSLAGRPGEVLTRAGARQRLGLTRQKETLQALKTIGLPANHVQFLGYPDRGLSALWRRHFTKPFQSPYTLSSRSPYPSYTPEAPYTGEQLLSDLKSIIARFRPTVAVYPHPLDTHRDHSALSAFVTCALREIDELDDSIGLCKRLMYFVHLGGWPTSRSNSGALNPPTHKYLAHETYVQVVGQGEQVETKREATAAYRSQMPLLGRFLMSFVHRNELFSLGPNTTASNIPTEAMIVGFNGPAGTKRSPLIPLPVRDRVSARIDQRGDISGIDVRLAGQTLLLVIGLQSKANSDLECRVTFWTCPRGHEITLRCRPPDRVTVLGKKRTEHLGALVRFSGKGIHLAIQGEQLGLPRNLFIQVETKSRGIVIDRSGIHFVVLPGWASKPDLAVFACATRRDLAACALIFKDGFSESLIHFFGRFPAQKLIRQVFHLFLDAEPEALIVAIAGGRVVGYVYAPTSLKRLWRAAFYEGHVRRWLLAWMRGRIAVGVAPMRLLLSNKYHFLRSAFRHDIAVDARILSVAVDGSAQGQGIGTRLVQHALHRFQRLGVTKVRLEVRPENQPAVRAYRRMGFKEVGETHDSQGSWSIMLCDLNHPVKPQKG